MNAVLILLIAILVAALGYRFYAVRMDRRVLVSDPKRATPATMYMDGVDFTPTSRNILFGYQFKSIAALGPIVGVIIAVQWGWLPAFLWIVLGTLFVGWVQDYTSAFVSLRNDGITFGGLSYRLISPRARIILLTFIYFYLLLVVAAFGNIVSSLLSKPDVPSGVIGMTVVGFLVGQMIYRWKLDILATTIISAILTFLFIWLGSLEPVAGIFRAVNGGEASPILIGSMTRAFVIWSLVTFLFCYLGAVLPIWRWAQPINYVAFWIVALGMLGAIIGIFVGHPSLSGFPAFTSFSIKIGPLWPVMFVTLACGAISGWHSLVSSSGTSRQLEKETDALPVTGGMMFAEMLLATISLIIAAAAVGGYGKYMEVMTKGGGAATVFAIGMGNLLSKIGIPPEFGTTYSSVFLTIMAITVMQLCLRFMRVASAEFVGDKIPIMRNIHFGTVVAVALALLLVWTGFQQYLWVLFGGANQLMAALALLIVSIWLGRIGKERRWTIYPMAFMYITTISALCYTSYNLMRKVVTMPNIPINEAIGNGIVSVIGAFLVLAALILAWDGIKALFSKG